MDNRKLFHFNKESLLEECIKRGKLVDELADKLKIIRDSLDYSWSLSPEGREEL